jgi:hypothetical protein
MSQIFLAPVLIAKGQMQQGTELIENGRKNLVGNQRRMMYAVLEYFLGEVNSQITTGQDLQ